MGWVHSVKLLLAPGRAERKDFKKMALIVVTLSLCEDVLSPRPGVNHVALCPCWAEIPLPASQAESRHRHRLQRQK